MAKWHVRADGSMGICKAKDGNCPFGGEAGTKHFTSESEARSYSESVVASSGSARKGGLSKGAPAPGPITVEYHEGLGAYVSDSDDWQTPDQIADEHGIDPKLVKDYLDVHRDKTKSMEVDTPDGKSTVLFDVYDLPTDLLEENWYEGYDTDELRDSMRNLDRMHDREFTPLKHDVENLIDKDDFEDPGEAQDVMDEIDDQMVEVENLMAELESTGGPLDGFDSVPERDTVFYRSAMASIADLEDMHDECSDLIDRLDARKEEIQDWIGDYEEDEE